MKFNFPKIMLENKIWMYYYSTSVNHIVGVLLMKIRAVQLPFSVTMSFSVTESLFQDSCLTLEFNFKYIILIFGDP